jgi:hypothetical protein
VVKNATYSALPTAGTAQLHVPRLNLLMSSSALKAPTADLQTPVATLQGLLAVITRDP